MLQNPLLTQTRLEISEMLSEMVPTNPVILKNCLEILSLLRLFADDMYLSDLPKLSCHFLLGGSSEKKHGGFK